MIDLLICLVYALTKYSSVAWNTLELRTFSKYSWAHSSDLTLCAQSVRVKPYRPDFLIKVLGFCMPNGITSHALQKVEPQFQ